GSTFWPADSLASPSQSPVGKLPKRTRGGSGRSSTEPFAHYDPASSSWRTSQTSLLSETGQPSETFSGTWPRAGMTRSGTAYQRRPLVPHTSGIGSSSWPTPDAGVFGLTADVDKHMARVARLKAKKINGNGAGIPLAVEVRRWPTPKATDGDRGGRGDLLAIVRDKPNAHTGSWPTPTARDWKDGSFSPNVPENGLLGRVVWRTPQAGDGNGGGQDPE